MYCPSIGNKSFPRLDYPFRIDSAGDQVRGQDSNLPTFPDLTQANVRSQKFSFPSVSLTGELTGDGPFQLGVLSLQAFEPDSLTFDPYPAFQSSWSPSSEVT